MPSFTSVDYTVTDGRAEIFLDEPDRLNAFDKGMLYELEEAIQAGLDDEGAYVILLSGRGQGFCSGADVTAMDGRDDREKKHRYGGHMWHVHNITRLLYFGDTPSVAAVNGPAVGAGCGFALAADLRVMSTESFLRQQFVNIGLTPGDGGGWLLPRLVGESKAKEYILTGKDITPEEAADVGLAVDVTDPDGLLDASRDLANEIRDKPAFAMQRSKDLIDVAQDFGEYTRAAQDAQWDCVHHPEHTEAVDALIEGREPDFDRSY